MNVFTKIDDLDMSELNKVFYTVQAIIQYTFSIFLTYPSNSHFKS